MGKFDDVKIGEKIVVKYRGDYHMGTVTKVTRTQFRLNTGERFMKRNGLAIGYGGEWSQKWAYPYNNTESRKAIEDYQVKIQQTQDRWVIQASQREIQKLLPKASRQTLEKIREILENEVSND